MVRVTKNREFSVKSTFSNCKPGKKASERRKQIKTYETSMAMIASKEHV